MADKPKKSDKVSKPKPAVNDDARRYADAPNKPDQTTIAQVEV